MIYFTADPHFDRKTIFDTTKRPFKNLTEMNACIIANYQSRIQAEDTLYFLGDLAHKTSSPAEARFWFDQIPGHKHLIKGNHDKDAVCDLPWDSVQDYLEVKIEGTDLVLFHYPILTWNQARAGTMSLFGHVHANWAGSNRSVNVGVDFWDFGACTLGEIKKRAETLPPPPHWDVVEPNDGLGSHLNSTR